MMPVDEHNPSDETAADVSDGAADPRWFRAPDRRERLIAVALFLGFGVFFLLLFVVNRGWWFRWAILGLALWSIGSAARHAMDARGATTRRAEGTDV